MTTHTNNLIFSETQPKMNGTNSKPYTPCWKNSSSYVLKQLVVHLNWSTTYQLFQNLAWAVFFSRVCMGLYMYTQHGLTSSSYVLKQLVVVISNWSQLDFTPGHSIKRVDHTSHRQYAQHCICFTGMDHKETIKSDQNMWHSMDWSSYSQARAQPTQTCNVDACTHTHTRTHTYTQHIPTYTLHTHRQH